MFHIMLLNNYNFLKFTLIALSFSLSGLFACMLFSNNNNNNTASAQQEQQTSNEPHNITTIANTLSLRGTATTMVKPDKVTVSLGIETTNKTADAALAANSKIMNQVIDVLKAVGVKDNETSTSSFSISPNYNYSQQQQSSDTTGRRIVGFTVSNSIQIQSTNINNTSKWIDTAVAAGANTVDRIDFALSDKKLQETKTNLIKQAMQDARTKADILASAAGMRAVAVRSINLDEFVMHPPFSPSPILLARQSPAGAEQARPTPIISGKEEVTANVDVVFLIR
jgi:uncharacterized protein YggE